MKRKIIKCLLIFFIGIIVGYISCNVYSNTIMESSNVSYNDSTVDFALNELYELSEKCSVGSNVSFTYNNATLDKDSIRLIVGKNAVISITPDAGYYLNNITCSGNINLSEYNTGTSATSTQLITLTNPNEINDVSCTINTKIVPYDATCKTTSGGTYCAAKWDCSAYGDYGYDTCYCSTTGEDFSGNSTGKSGQCCDTRTNPDITTCTCPKGGTYNSSTKKCM